MKALRLVMVITAIFMLLSAMSLVSADPAAQVKSRVYVVFKAGQKGLVERALHNNDADFHYTFDDLNAFVVSVPEQALQGLSRNPNIDYIEEDVKRYPYAQVKPWGIPAVQADLVDDSAAGNRTVCIIDSGYSFNSVEGQIPHEDLPANVSFTNNSGSGNPYIDSCGHGTHVAGTIAALSNSIGVVGVLPNNKINLHIVKVFGDDDPDSGSCSWTYSSSLVAALGACGDANVVNMSLGGPLKNRTEDRAFRNYYDAGGLSVAAAGNDGNTRKSYPASYDSVISVAAVDSANLVADFSQKNPQVELAAPGVAVQSTVPMGKGSDVSVMVGSDSYEATALEGSPAATAPAGNLFKCPGVDDCSGLTSGQVCLIERGSVTFADKVLECESQGGVAAIIYNNSESLFSGTLGGVDTAIPSVGVSGVTGNTLLTKEGHSTVVSVSQGNYAFYDGTSMATPHVSGVAALVWSNKPDCSNQDIRNALIQSALDLGIAGRDDAYGYGLVQAQEAINYLGDNCGSNSGNNTGGDGGNSNFCPIDDTLLLAGASCSSDSECCSNSCKGKPGNKTCK